MIKSSDVSRWFLAVALIAVCVAGPVKAQDKVCDRSCLKNLAHQVLVSMTKHDASVLPLARWYTVTENNRPSAPGMTSFWRTITDIQEPVQYIIDTPNGQVFVIAGVLEGKMPDLLWGRLKVENGKISEMELYIARAKSDSGLQFNPEGMSSLPDGWTAPIPAGQKVSREELTRIAQSIFSLKYGTPAPSEDCILVENGKQVIESDEALKVLAEGAPPGALDGIKKTSEGDIVPCGLPVDRPEDAHAQMIVDEEQGIAIASGVVPGIEYSSFCTKGNETTFVPTAMNSEWVHLPAKMHDPNPAGLDPSQQSYVPVSRSWPTVVYTTEVLKYYGGKVHGEHRLEEMQPVGSGSLWEQMKR